MDSDKLAKKDMLRAMLFKLLALTYECHDVEANLIEHSTSSGTERILTILYK